MKSNDKYGVKNRVGFHLASVLLIPLVLIQLLTGCERRDLWVLAEEYRQVELVTDWSEAEARPNGMTAWFINNDYSGYNRNYKTSEVTHTWLSLPRGNYTGLVFDYSPEEYGHIQFVNMDDPDLAEVCLKPAADQPKADETELFGDVAVPAGMQGIERNEENGLYIVKAEPDAINLDALHDVDIVTGSDGDYILWKEREQYESSLVTQTLNAWPKPIVWKLHVLVYVKGIYYMNSVRASIAGLADGYMMSQGMHSEDVCLQALDEWSSKTIGENIGTISTTAMTFGLPEYGVGGGENGVATREDDEGVVHEYLSNLRLNLQFLLRDQETVLDYHYDCQPYVNIFEDQLVVRIDIPIELAPELPYVEAKGSAGFDATVSPWEDGGTVETTM